MKDTTQKLRDDLIQVRNILKNGTLLTLSREEKDAMLTDSQNLLEKLDSFAQSFFNSRSFGWNGCGEINSDECPGGFCYLVHQSPSASYGLSSDLQAC